MARTLGKFVESTRLVVPMSSGFDARQIRRVNTAGCGWDAQAFNRYDIHAVRTAR